MATQIDPNFVVTSDNLEGYRIVKYLGMVWGFDSGISFRGKTKPDAILKNQLIMIKKAEGMGANAIISTRTIFREFNGDTDEPVFFGTAVIIEPIQAG